MIQFRINNALWKLSLNYIDGYYKVIFKDIVTLHNHLVFIIDCAGRYKNKYFDIDLTKYNMSSLRP